MTGNHKKKNCLSVMLMVVLAMALILAAGDRMAKAAERDDYSLTVNMADQDFVKDDPKLENVTLNIYKLADTDWQQAGRNVTEPEFGKAAVSYVIDHEMEVIAQSVFGTPKRLEEKGLYVVIPTLGDDIRTNAAGNVMVTTDEWAYTFCPMVISVPANAVIYVKTERQPVRDAKPPEYDQTTIVDSDINGTRDVKTGDVFRWYPLLVAAAAAVLVALIRHKKADAR